MFDIRKILNGWVYFPKKISWNFLNISETFFQNISCNISSQKIMKFYITSYTYDTAHPGEVEDGVIEVVSFALKTTAERWRWVRGVRLRRLWWFRIGGGHCSRLGFARRGSHRLTWFRTHFRRLLGGWCWTGSDDIDGHVLRFRHCDGDRGSCGIARLRHHRSTVLLHAITDNSNVKIYAFCYHALLLWRIRSLWIYRHQVGNDV